MDRNQVKTVMNRELSRFLYRARRQSRESASQISARLGISETTLLAMEAKPAEVPCRDLYRLFQHYGPEKMRQAQLVLIDAQATIFSGNRGIRFGLNSRKLEMPVHRFPRWAENLLAVIGGRLCSDFLKLVASLAIFR
jgi:hypothetical protein